MDSFSSGYAVAGDVDHLREMAPVIAVEPYISLQVCQHITSIQGLSATVIEVVNSLYCPE